MKAARKKGRRAFRKSVLFFTSLFLLIQPAKIVLSAEAAWQAEWSKTVDAALKEGQLNVYYWGPPYVLDGGAFQKKFPQIKLVVVSGQGGQLQQRILSERRGDKFIADVFIDGASNFHPNMFKAKALDPIKAALILPEVTDESKWWHGKLKYLDAERQSVIAFAGSPNYGTIGYNTTQMAPKEFKSYWDFLQPKWKGKIAARDIAEAGGGSSPMRFFYYNPELGSPFIRRLFGEMDVTLFRDSRQAIDWLGSGKFAICFFCPGVETAKRQGLPVDDWNKLLKEGAGISGQVGYIGLVNKAPHPHAAKVFINWFLSREGQIAFQQEQAKADSARDSLRIDIPKDYIPPGERRIDGGNYVELDSPDMMDMEPVRKVFREALGAKP
ncbi:MAG TPA: extracellular solute-binding protein [Candidatus Binatia bacterium]|jgi:iron(III) transport system substrate-binding protein